MSAIWISLFGKRIGIMCDDGSPPLFSERYGYVRVYRFLGFKLKIR